jgi:biotin carboxyl carrier protein
MKLALIIDGAENSLEILSPAPQCRFRMNGSTDRDAHVETPEPGVYSILLDGRSYDARVEMAPGGGVIVVIDGSRFEIEVRDPRRWTRNAGGGTGEKVENLAAPMPGKVVRVLVASGQEVSRGQGILVVEAMKMQNEIKAPRAGRVVLLSAKEGVAVAAGDVLATIG